MILRKIFMFESKKSRCVFSKSLTVLIFLLCVVCYGQDKKVSEKGASKKNRIFAVKPKTIELPPDKVIVSANASDNEKQLFLSEKKGLVYAFDLETTEQIWMTDLGGKISSNLIEAGNLIYIITSKNDIFEKTNNTNYISVKKAVDNNSVLWAIDKKSGITSGKVEIAGNKDFYIFNSGKFVYVVNDSKVSVFGQNLDNFIEIYSVEEKLAGQPLFDKQRENLYLIFENGVVELKTGKDKLIHKKTVFDRGKIIVDAFAVSDGAFFVGDAVGNLYAFDRAAETEIWKFRAGGKISDIEVFDDKILVSSFDNFIYCLQKSDGERIWKKRFPGRISEIRKSSDEDFLVRSIYSADFYLVDILSGDIVEQYTGNQRDDLQRKAIRITPRLIMILKSNLIDIFKKN